MEYRIYEASSPELLERKVRKALDDGWRLQGGVAVMPLGDDQYIYAQALVR